MTVTLLRRDLPIQPGRKLRFTFTIAYEVTVDNDLLGDSPETLAEIEAWLGDNGSSERIWRALHDQYDREVIEHEVTLADVNFGPGDDPRFEVEWERRLREGGASAGDELLRRSRTWLDEIPAPNVGASA